MFALAVQLAHELTNKQFAKNLNAFTKEREAGGKTTATSFLICSSQLSLCLKCCLLILLSFCIFKNFPCVFDEASPEGAKSLWEEGIEC